jgi:two-component system OmpR family response regulator
VLTATSGRAAITQAALDPPAVVLLDLSMPGMDGYQTQAALRAQTPDVPVVFMSTRDRVWREAAAHQAAGALPKPFDVDLVLDTVARFIPPPAP